MIIIHPAFVNPDLPHRPGAYLAHKKILKRFQHLPFPFAQFPLVLQQLLSHLILPAHYPAGSVGSEELALEQLRDVDG